MWLYRGNLIVVAGTLRFIAAGSEFLQPGEYDIPYQTVSLILLGPGTTVSHDALRLMARHGTGLVAVGEDGVRLYSAPPLGPDHSQAARRQATLWADPEQRLQTALRLYSWRMGGEELPFRDLSKVRGIEGARMRETYKLLARQFGIQWRGRRYDRSDPESDDPPNQAINHAATAVQAAGGVAVAATATIPQLGFIHEDSSRAFVLDVADLFRDEFTLPIAFRGVKAFHKDPSVAIERHVRRLAGVTFRREGLIPKMIERIKELLNVHDGGGDAQRA